MRKGKEWEPREKSREQVWGEHLGFGKKHQTAVSSYCTLIHGVGGRFRLLRSCFVYFGSFFFFFFLMSAISLQVISLLFLVWGWFLLRALESLAK